MLHHSNLIFREEFQNRPETSYIVLHHTEVKGRHNVREVHQWHLNRKTSSNEPWAGIGYHFYVDKDGEIFTGRPVGARGAHVRGFNRKSVGVCFEGHFDIETMSGKQEEASVMLLALLSLVYPNAKFVKHHDLNKEKTCPGKNFPYDNLMQKVEICKSRLISLFGEPLPSGKVAPNANSFDYSTLLDF